VTDAMSTGAGSDMGDAGAASAQVVRAMGWFDRYGVLLMVFLMGILSWLAQPDVFLSERNIFNIFRQTAFYQMLALGQFIVIVTAGIDLSIGSVMALAMMCSAILASSGAPWPLVVLAPLLAGLLVGSVNGLGLTKLHMPHPFIMTLGMMFVARGATYLISNGRPITGMPREVTWLGSGNLDVLGLHIPVSLVVVVITFVIAWVFLQHLRTGRHIYALGGNPQAARVSGINVDRTLVIAYALCGFMAGFAGLLLAGRTNSGFPNAGEGDELVAISAVIIGGASFFGGRGTVLGVFAGVLVIGMLRNLLNLSNVQVFWQQVLIGVVIIGVVAFDVLRRRLAAAS
jgi:ribose/xylose/arabinose/galactoside ABC-type transport system permease subunit